MADQTIEYIPCTHCAGSGKQPSHRTGELLRQLREDGGVSRAEVASAMDISEAYLGDLERGNRNWSNRHVRLFQKAVGELGDENTS